MGGEHAVLAVDGHDVPRAQQREHRPQLLLARVTGDVHGRDLLVEHLRARAGELVDRVVDAQLVPGNRLRRDDDGVSRLDRDGLVVAVRDSRQGRHRLALASRAEDEELVRRKLRGLVRVDDRVLRERDVAEVPRDVEVLAHRAPDDDDLPPALHGDVGGLLHAMDVRRERRDEDLPRAEREDRAERLSDEPLGAGVAGPLRVRRVAEEEVDSAVPDLRQRADVGLEPVHGRVVELPVTRVDHAPGVGLDHERRRVGDRVGDADELDAKRAEHERRVARLRSHELGLLPQPVLVELRLDEGERERRRDDGIDVDLAQEVRQAADVILVAVREHDRADPAPLEVADVGQEEIDAEVLVAREGEARVDDDDLSPISKTVMFFPTSPRPPSGMIRSVSLIVG